MRINPCQYEGFGIDPGVVIVLRIQQDRDARQHSIQLLPGGTGHSENSIRPATGLKRGHARIEANKVRNCLLITGHMADTMQVRFKNLTNTRRKMAVTVYEGREQQPPLQINYPGLWSNPTPGSLVIPNKNYPILPGCQGLCHAPVGVDSVYIPVNKKDIRLVVLFSVHLPNRETRMG